MSLGVFGPVVFQVSADLVRTWQEARRNGTARWAQHDVFSGKPKQEFIGPGLDTIDLVIRFDIELGVVPRDELRQLRDIRDSGVPQQFTVGGDLVGDFVLRSIGEDWRHVSRNGVLVIAYGSISLEEYA